MEQPVAEEKGMSKGCLVGLIVGGVLLLMTIAVCITCWVKRDDMMRYAVSSMINHSKEDLNKNSYGMDTVAVNRFFDAFLVKVDSVKIEDPAVGQFFQTATGIVNDNKVTDVEAKQLMEAMATLYPELRPLLPFAPTTDTTAAVPSAADSTAKQTPVDSSAQPK